MRYSIRMFTVAALLVLGIVSWGVAQMMGNSDGHMSQMQADSTEQQGQMGMMNMMHNMSEHCQMMAGDFDELTRHFDQMMQIDDLKTLKAKMSEHQEMMAEMQQDMKAQKKVCQHMMSMMHSGDTQGMMGMNCAGQSGSGCQHSQDN